MVWTQANGSSDRTIWGIPALGIRYEAPVEISAQLYDESTRLAETVLYPEYQTLTGTCEDTGDYICAQVEVEWVIKSFIEE